MAAGARIRNAARAANDVDGAKGEGSGTQYGDLAVVIMLKSALDT